MVADDTEKLCLLLTYDELNPESPALYKKKHVLILIYFLLDAFHF